MAHEAGAHVLDRRIGTHESAAERLSTLARDHRQGRHHPAALLTISTPTTPIATAQRNAQVNWSRQGPGTLRPPRRIGTPVVCRSGRRACRSDAAPNIVRIPPVTNTIQSLTLGTPTFDTSDRLM